MATIGIYKEKARCLSELLAVWTGHVKFCLINTLFTRLRKTYVKYRGFLSFYQLNASPARPAPTSYFNFFPAFPISTYPFIVTTNPTKDVTAPIYAIDLWVS